MDNKDIILKAEKWLSEAYDKETRDEVELLIKEGGTKLVDSFYKNLDFGTGGIRGIMGVGTNRMNKYTVGMATQGLANYLLKTYPEEEIKVAVSFDSRNNSPYFSQIVAEVLSANGIKVYLFESLRPTPELSFAVRYLQCNAGIMITASHNPKEYNGYKVYWNDGGQLVPPHDNNTIEEVKKIDTPEKVKFDKNPDLIHIIGNDIDTVYWDLSKAFSLNLENNKAHSNLPIVFTPIHGTGIMGVPQMLKLFGFNNVNIVEAQSSPDGNFPTVISPNPEEEEALSLAIEKAQKIGAELVLATDPDSDRVGIACKNDKNEFVLLNGNQTASILFYYVLNQWKEKGKFKGNEFVVKTIVTSELLVEIAKKYNVEYFDVLTGFKYIAEIITNNEGEKRFVVGGEESYGYLVGDLVRDKDAVISCCMIAEAAAWAKSKGKTLYDILIDIYLEFGLYKEDLLSITKTGKAGADEIKSMMEDYRTSAPSSINGEKVVEIRDYQLSETNYVLENSKEKINLPKSDVIQFFTDGSSVVTVRPSGTEPKIKFYFGVKGELKNRESFHEAMSVCNKKIEGIKTSMKLE